MKGQEPALELKPSMFYLFFLLNYLASALSVKSQEAMFFLVEIYAILPLLSNALSNQASTYPPK